MRYIFGLLVCIIMALEPVYAQDWLQLTSGVDKRLYGVEFISPDTGWVIGSYGTLLHTTNGGELWETSPYQIHGDAGDIYFRRICFISRDIGFITGSFMDTIANSQRTLLLRTSDQGKTWIQSPQDTIGWISDISFPDSDHGYICGLFDRPPGSGLGAFLARTSDRGITWTYDFSIKHYFYRMGFRDSGIGFGFYSSEPYTWVNNTTDDGITWNNDFRYGIGIPSVYGQYDLKYIGNSTWIFATSIGILRSTDDGERWQHVDSLDPSEAARSLSFFDHWVGYCLTGDYDYPKHIRKTTDGGVTWQLNYRGTEGITALRSIAAPGQNIAYAVGDSGVILKTTNGGGTTLSVSDESQSSSTGLSIMNDPVTGRAHCGFAATTTPRTLLICDLIGRTIMTKIIDSGTNTSEFDTSTLPTGLYLCRLGNQTARFVVQ